MTAVTETPTPEELSVIADSPRSDDLTSLARRTLFFLLAVLAVAGLIVGGRMAVGGTRHTAAPIVPAAGYHIPASPAIESSWGIRFTDVIVLADNGGVELRYQVLDTGKADKIHLGDATSNELPTIKVEGTHASITPSAVLMHFHHGDSADGRSYSIVYGNAGGVVSAGSVVSIVMKDGATLQHARVTD